MKIKDKIKTNVSGTCVVLDIKSSIGKGPIMILVEFPTGTKQWVRKGNLLLGKVKDPLFPAVQGIGYLGEGSFAKKDKKLYTAWVGMLRRCYSEDFHKSNPTYIGCSVVKRWHNFQNFCEDLVQMSNWNTPGFELDKDLRVIGNKKYGPKYCSFVPARVNTATVVKSKTIIEGIRKVGNKFKAQIKIGDKLEYLGYFTTEDEAVKVRYQRKRRHWQELAKEFKPVLHPQVYATLRSY